jgi:ABC-type nickel/cobalt efflux system permease component RcnA
MCTRRIVAGLAGALAIALPAYADTVASLLGNFTVNQFAGLRVSERAIGIRYSVVYGQLPALRELHAADADGDGVTTQAEREAHAQVLSREFVRGFTVTENGRPVPLRASAWSTSLPTEQGGFSLRLDVDLAGELTERGPRTIAFANDNYSRQFGWQEIAVSSAPGIAVYDTDAFSTSLTNGLEEAPRELPESGPLSERRVRFAFTTGALPAGAVPIAPRAGAPAMQTRDEDASGWLRAQTRRIVDLIATPSVSPGVVALALLAAMVLGALHAFAPGHGKTVVGAYLVGSRATARHAAFLGLTVTVTHTIGVFALGFATLFASAYVVPERVFPVLGLVSGLVVLGMGVTLAIQRWPAARDAMRRHAFRVAAAQGTFMMGRMQHAHAASGWHSHGGTWHTHAPPPDRVTWRSLLALGVSGGLVPCPSAMVLLLAAVALNKTAFGLALVVAFSAGLAMTLTVIGLAFLYARNRLPTGARAPRWTRIVPLASAAAIAMIGALLCHAALSGGPV